MCGGIFGGDGSVPGPVADTVKTPVGETGTAAAAAKRKPRSLLSRSIGGDQTQAQVNSGLAVGKQTLGA